MKRGFNTAARNIFGGIVFLAMLVCLLITYPSPALAASVWDGASSSTDWTGSGTSGDPYVISTAAQLKGLADSVNSGTSHSGSFFKLDDDINLADYAWTPIGGHCPLTADEEGVPTGLYFGGVFDGRNHTISGINICNPTAGTGAYGLFGYVNGGIIANLNVAGSLDMGDNHTSAIGSVVGYTAGSLYNLHSSMTVSVADPTATTASQAGGIAGVVANTNRSPALYVRYCSNTGDVTARGRIGGIVGAVYCLSDGGVIVDQCFNTGYIKSVYSTKKIFTGGIVGYCEGYITNCYNQGNMETNNGHYLAGITGILTGATPVYPVASMSNCYSTAYFTGYAVNYDRWLWGSADHNPAVHITNCFYIATNDDMTQPNLDDTWGTQTHVSSITTPELQGKVEMTGSNRSGTFSGYVVPNYLGSADLDIPNGSYGFGYALSGGYPILGWQQIPDFIVDLSNLPSPVTHYTISASVSEGSGTVTVDPATVSNGGSSTITISPASGYYLASITDNGIDVLGSVSSNIYTINNINANHTVVVSFSNDTYTLTYTAGEHGYISGNTSQTVASGASGTGVTAVPESGFQFANWSDGSTDNPRTDTNVTANISVKAIFIKDNTGGSRPQDHFTIAVLPDTQFYSESYPAIFDQQTQWITDNAQSKNIIFVAHLGDIVNDYNNSTQWQNARDSMAIIRAAGIPYSVVPGNHDMHFTTFDLTNYDTYFPYTDFIDYTWYGGHHPDHSNASSYQLFSAMGQDFIVLNLVCAPSLLADAADWANSVLTQYNTRKAIIITHGYIDANGNCQNTRSVAGFDIWHNIVKLHGNVIAVLCGHYSGQYNNTSTGLNGNTIHNLLSDYQEQPNGGNGWLRLYEFYPHSSTIKTVTYSPYLAQYDTSIYGQFELSLEQTGTETAPPMLTADSSNNSPAQVIELTFTDDQAWRNAISDITVNGASVAGKYTISAGSISFDATVFTAKGEYAVVVKAGGYADAEITQTILNPAYEIIPAADVSYEIGATVDGIKTMTVKSGVSGLNYFNVGVIPVRVHNGKETVVFSHLRDGAQNSLNSTILDFDAAPGAQAIAGFNVRAADIIKVFVVDVLSNAENFNPTIFN